MLGGSTSYKTNRESYPGISTGPGLVAQSLERWTPRGESTRSGYNSPSSTRDGRSVYEHPDGYALTDDGMAAVCGRPVEGSEVKQWF